MGWVWVNDDDDYNTNRISSFANDDVEFRASSSPYANEIPGRCATRKIEASQCRTEEVVPGKFIRRCDKAEQVFKDCIGRYWIVYYDWEFRFNLLLDNTSKSIIHMCLGISIQFTNDFALFIHLFDLLRVEFHLFEADCNRLMGLRFAGG